MDELRKRQKIISQLVEARLEQGISQAELARRLGIQRSGINRLESGTQNPTLDLKNRFGAGKGCFTGTERQGGAYEQCLQSPHL